MSQFPESVMGQLRISLFGDFKVERRGENPLRVTRTVRQLLAYLLLGRNRNHSRDVIVDVFWQDYPVRRARSCLNTTLWRLRRLLEPEGVSRGTYLLCSPSGEVRFNSESDLWLDVAVLDEGIRGIENCSAQGADVVVAGKLRTALDVYAGELLEDMYDDWALVERERYRVAYLNGLAWLMRFHQTRREWDLSAECARKILRVDPLREEIHRELIRVLKESGRRTEAVRQFECCRRLLEEELGVEPMEETRILVSEVETRVRNARRRSSNTGPPSLQEALLQLRKAERELALARQNVELAADRLAGSRRDP